MGDFEQVVQGGPGKVVGIVVLRDDAPGSLKGT